MSTHQLELPTQSELLEGTFREWRDTAEGLGLTAMEAHDSWALTILDGKHPQRGVMCVHIGTDAASDPAVVLYVGTSISSWHPVTPEEALRFVNRLARVRGIK